MRSADSATTTHLQSRGGVIPRELVWVSARNRETGAVETMGLWNGDETSDIEVISAETGVPEVRTYIQAFGILSVGQIPMTTDLGVRNVTIRLSQISAAVQQLVRGYDVRLAPIEVHRALFHVDSRQLVAAPVPRFIGWVNKAPITTPAAGGEGGISISAVSHTRELTRVNPLRRSDEQQKLREGDRFRRYNTVAGEWEITWGEEKATASGSSGFTAPGSGARSNPNFNPILNGGR